MDGSRFVRHETNQVRGEEGTIGSMNNFRLWKGLNMRLETTVILLEMSEEAIEVLGTLLGNHDIICG